MKHVQALECVVQSVPDVLAVDQVVHYLGFEHGTRCVFTLSHICSPP